VAADRPGAQLALGRLLRQASDLIEEPTFDEKLHAEVTNLIHIMEAWVSPATHVGKYREALVERRRGQELPDFNSLEDVGNQTVRNQLQALLETCPTEEAISGATPSMLTIYDQTIAKLALLWRERERPWAEQLAKECERGRSIQALFRLGDAQFWEELKEKVKSGTLTLKRYPTDEKPLRTYDLLEVSLESTDFGKTAAGIFKHKFAVIWTITVNGHKKSSAETDGLKLAQYFSEPGGVSVEAILSWEGKKIPGTTSDKNPLELYFEVKKNPDFSSLNFITSGGFTEGVVLAIAAGFAVATAMVTQYDATFGSFSQYLTLFLWAAGAGIGGNIFKQLGETGTPGGRPDATLPAAAGK